MKKTDIFTDKMYEYGIVGQPTYVSGKDLNNGLILHRDSKGCFINEKKLKCCMCNKQATDTGHDPCIANLPGVASACCGHGETKGYIEFENGIIIRGFFEVEKL